MDKELITMGIDYSQLEIVCNNYNSFLNYSFLYVCGLVSGIGTSPTRPILVQYAESFDFLISPMQYAYG